MYDCVFCENKFGNLVDIVFHVEHDHFNFKAQGLNSSALGLTQTFICTIGSKIETWFSFLRKIVVDKLTNLIMEKLLLHSNYKIEIVISVTFNFEEDILMEDFEQTFFGRRNMTKTSIHGKIMQALGEIYSDFECKMIDNKAEFAEIDFCSVNFTKQ